MLLMLTGGMSMFFATSWLFTGDYATNCFVNVGMGWIVAEWVDVAINCDG